MKIKTLVFLFALCAFASIVPQAASAQAQWSTGYWADAPTEPISGIDWAGLTHVIHWTIYPNADGSIQFQCAQSNCSQSSFTSYANNLIGPAHTHGVKVLLGLDVNGTSADWNGATSSGNLSTFVSNLVSAVNTYGYDGIDVDCESSVSMTQLGNFFVALRSAIGSGKLISSTTGDTSTRAFYATMAPYLDRLGVQTYGDPTYSDNLTWFNSALYSDSTTTCNSAGDVGTGGEASAQWYANCFINAGFPASKVEIGLAFFGYVMHGTTAPRQSLSGVTDSQYNYNTLFNNYNLSSATWDATAHVPWLPISGGYVTFDNAQAITDKVNYAKTNNLGGWIIWNVSSDYMSSGITPASQHPLLAAVAAAMGTSTSKDIYLAQSATGTGSGASCANALAYTYFNSSGNWTSGISQRHADRAGKHRSYLRHDHRFLRSYGAHIPRQRVVRTSRHSSIRERSRAHSALLVGQWSGHRFRQDLHRGRWRLEWRDQKHGQWNQPRQPSNFRRRWAE